MKGGSGEGVKVAGEDLVESRASTVSILPARRAFSVVIASHLSDTALTWPISICTVVATAVLKVACS